MQRGMSLIELLVYIAILSIVVVVLSATYVSFVGIRAKTEAVAATDTALRYVSETLTRDVERASSISAPALGDTGIQLTLVQGSSTIIYALTNGSMSRSVDGVLEILTSDRVTITSFDVRRTANSQSLTVRSHEGVQWLLEAEHSYGGGEYRYDAARKGAASLRIYE
ncbi:hypothetical protein A3C87_00130 [Candidatus Kaiserbacteria bacterium RIFCSPHIGHO2_02_FULL_49_34]|uniref:Prepilin-type N-terminal cleavage/methylation domain-containing protein n=1 Tax=Candidatus Kaiserbacteria bacterium RIFCSPHIGHO2_02_FULL_49_34 TaxID=1798491 RepID=A0A1F6DJ05_9BACT|nr:MAG: hypothetical protein A3C87_00130 [Candidatus Kaiserbacteria bacterium RIFCSPHIGHO2_02_FULL_49_34]